MPSYCFLSRFQRFDDTCSSIASFQFHPVISALGPRLGPNLSECVALLRRSAIVDPVPIPGTGDNDRHRSPPGRSGQPQATPPQGAGRIPRREGGPTEGEGEMKEKSALREFEAGTRVRLIADTLAWRAEIPLQGKIGEVIELREDGRISVRFDNGRLLMGRDVKAFEKAKTN
jgi:hypothetical protein